MSIINSYSFGGMRSGFRTCGIRRSTIGPRWALGVLETSLGSLLLGALVAPSDLAALDVPAVSVGAGLTLAVVLRLGGAGVLGALGSGSTTASTARPITHV